MILSTGVIREIDELGRIVLPKEIRNRFNIKKGDEISINIENAALRLYKLDRTCVLCEESRRTDPHIFYMDRKICQRCIDELKSFHT